MAETFFHINVKNTNGSSYTIKNLTEATKVSALMEKVYEAVGSREEGSLLLIHRGRVINDPSDPANLNQTMEALDIIEWTTLSLVYRLKT